MAKKAHALARGYARGERGAVKRVNQLLAERGRTIDEVLADAFSGLERASLDRLANEAMGDPATYQASIARSYARAKGFGVERLRTLETLDRFIMMAENRRNSALREIDRRRAALGDALRRNLPEVEVAEVKLIEPTSAKSREAA